jgi:hypothetical protein
MLDELKPFGQWTRPARVRGCFGKAILHELEIQELLKPKEVLMWTSICVVGNDRVLVTAICSGDDSEPKALSAYSLTYTPEAFTHLFGCCAGKLTADD